MNEQLKEAITEEECRTVCKYAYDNNFAYMRQVYEQRITQAKNINNLRRVELFNRDLDIIKALEKEQIS